MKLVLNNPFRQFGLLANASALESNRQIRRTYQFIEAGQEPEEAYSMYSIGEMNRSDSSLQSAKEELDLDKSKLEWSLFWFVNLNKTYDDAALDALKKGEFSIAESTWRLQINDAFQIVNDWNYSAYQNLSTYYLSRCTFGENLNLSLLHSAIQLKMQLLESEYIRNIKDSICDANYIVEPKDLVKTAFNRIKDELISRGLITVEQLIRLVSKVDFRSKHDVVEMLIKSVVDDIKELVQKTKADRKQAVNHSNLYGKKLYENTRPALNTVSQSLGDNSQIYASIADKVADEILQCGIDYFNHLKDSEMDPSTDAVELIELASSLAKGKLVEQRCADNMKNINEWIDDKPNRERIKPIKEHLERLAEIAALNQTNSNSASSARKILRESLPVLNEIKNKIGESNVTFVNVSTTLANITQGMCVDHVNRLIKRFENTFYDHLKRDIISELISVLDDSQIVLREIGNMTLSSSFRVNYQENVRSLNSLRSNLGLPQSGSSTSAASGSNCYIATMAYGDIHHPQVELLRQYRDNVLKQYSMGRCAIWLYYKVSPHLVELVKDIAWIHIIARSILDRFISRIKL